ncbi:MAG: inositol monophosphatase [Anaerolineae bacterium]|nr:inositol monophosphatase [Anaerolineae bacterium]
MHPLVSPVALETVARIAREAGALIRDTYGAHGAVDFKGTVNPVTQTDKAAEALIFSGLEEAFPDPRILGEESGGDSALGSFTGTDPLWLVDPLDGTNNFAHGFPHFCVSIGLAARGAVQLGVIYDPMRDEIFTTMRGHGAHLDGQSIHVSDTAKLADAFLAAGFSYARRVVAENNARMLDVFLRRSQGVRRAGSAALDLAYVACGRFDAFWEPGLSPWDIAAGLLLVEEAGGRFSDFSGGDSRVFSEGELLASNGKIHDEMLRVLREGRGAPHPDFPSLSS